MTRFADEFMGPPPRPARSTLTHRLEALRPMTSVAEMNAHRERLRRELAEGVTIAMGVATREGMPAGEAAEITAIAAADLLRGMYGNSQCQVLAQKIVDRAGAGFEGEES